LLKQTTTRGAVRARRGLIHVIACELFQENSSANAAAGVHATIANAI
jgi:hypothetical protein